MRDHAADLDRLNVKIVVVTFEPDVSSVNYVKETALTWPLIVDETRTLYKSYGMESASFLDIWGPKTWLAYIKELLKGQKLKKSDADIRQRGGDVLIDPDGIVRLHHVGAGPGDRPGVEMILKATSKNCLLT